MPKTAKARLRQAFEQNRRERRKRQEEAATIYRESLRSKVVTSSDFEAAIVLAVLQWVRDHLNQLSTMDVLLESCDIIQIKEPLRTWTLQGDKGKYQFAVMAVKCVSDTVFVSIEARRGITRGSVRFWSDVGDRIKKVIERRFEYCVASPIFTDKLCEFVSSVLNFLIAED